jgi:RNA polymerase sigma factor (sigma-70 family)
MLPNTRTLLDHLRRLAPPAAPDASLLADWLSRRDEGAFAALVTRHGPMVLGVCRRILRDAHDAEDAFQATFLVLARQAARLRRPEALAGYLYSTALRLAWKARRAAHRRRSSPGPDGPERADAQPDPLDVLSGRELLAMLDEEVARLPDRYRLPVLLCVLQERTVEEVAGLLGWGVGSVRGRLARGRQRLRKRLARRGVRLSAGAGLLLPAAVPERLLAESVGNLSGPVPRAVSTLAGGIGTMAKPLAVCFSLLVLAAVGLGAGLGLLRPEEPEEHPAPAPAAPAPAAEEPRRDRHGDPLPPGAVARLGTLRFRAPGEVMALALAPDGRTIAVSSLAGLFLFDAASGKRVRFLSGSHPNSQPRWKVVFSPDGKRLATQGYKVVDRQFRPAVCVWDVAGVREPQDYPADHVAWVGWSPEGEPLAVCLEEGALHLHELAAGRSRRFACKDLPAPTLSEDVPVACAPVGRTLAVMGEKHIVHIWDTQTIRERCTCRPEKGRLWSLALSPDGNRLVCCSEQELQVWDVPTAKVLYSVAGQGKYAGARFSADGKTLAVADSRRSVCFWDAATGQERGRTKEPYHPAPGFALSDDGKTLVTTEWHSEAIHLWDVPGGTRKAEPAGHRCEPNGTSFSPDGRRVATCGSMDGTIHVWDLATAEPLASIHRPGQWVRRDCAFSRDGRSLFSAWTDEELWVSDADTGERRQAWKLEDPERKDTRQSGLYMHLSADDKTLVAFSYYYHKGGGLSHRDTLITGWDASTGRQLFRRRRAGLVSGTALSLDARVLALACSAAASDTGQPLEGAGAMRLENVATGEHLLTFPALEGQTFPLAFSPDGRLLAANNSNVQPEGKEWRRRDHLSVWEIATAAQVLELPAADPGPAAFSRDGRLLALASPGGEILIWDLEQGRERRRWKGFEAGVTWLAFSPDGRRLVSGLADSTLLVWDVGPRPAGPPEKLGAEGLAKAWADLAGDDAPRAFRARWTLTTAADEAFVLLKDRLRPVKEAEPRRLRRLLADLDSDHFAVRQKAQQELEDLGDLAEPAMREALAGKPTLELRRSVEKLLEGLRGPSRRPEVLRGVRAVAVLEGIGTPAARRLLEDLAAGAPGSRLTQEAKASLRHLDRQSLSDR